MTQNFRGRNKHIYKKRMMKTKTALTATFLITALLILSNVVTASSISVKSLNIKPNEINMPENTLDRHIAPNDLRGNLGITTKDTRSHEDPLLTSADSYFSEVVFEEDFEEAWVPDSDGDLAPPEWEVINNSEGYNFWKDPMFWYQYQEDNERYIHSGEYSAAIGQDDNFDNSIHQDEWLISPNITLPYDCTLQFRSNFLGYDWLVEDHDYVKILNESGWTTIDDLSYNYENSYEWLQFEYDLSSYTNQAINIAFHRNATAKFGDEIVTHYWFVDDVSIFKIEFHDVGVTNITSPVDGPAGVIITPEVIVQNFGGVNETDVPVNMKIFKDEDLEYNETVYVDFPYEVAPEVASFGGVNVIFPDWIPNDWQVSKNIDIEYEVIACTMLEEDENTSNDCISEIVTLHYPYFHDVGVSSIDSPSESGPAQTFPVEVTIKNLGQFEECCFKTYVEIAEIGYENPFEIWCEDFSEGVPPEGWSQDPDNAWVTSYSNYAGETSPEAQLVWYWISDDNAWLKTHQTDTTDADALELEFNSYIDNYVYGGLFNCSVWIRGSPSDDWVDITPWTNPINSDVGPDTYIVDASAGIGPATEIMWEFDGCFLCLDYWYLDDACLTGYSALEPEYSEFTCPDFFDPGEEQELEFPDWTPVAIGEGISGTRTYTVTAFTNLTDPLDENRSNDDLTVEIELDFSHDVAVKEITQPGGGRNRGDTWIYYDDGEVYAGIELTGGGTYQGAIRITPDELTGHGGWELTKVKFYHYEEGTHYGDVFIYEAGTPTQPGPLITSEPFSVTGEDWQEITLSEPIVVNENEDVWVSINITHADGEYPLGVDDGPAVDGKGDWVSTDGINWEELQNLGLDLDYNWMIRALLVGEEEPDIYIGAGTHPVEAIILNNGTFPESNFTAYATIYNEAGDPIYESNYTIEELEAGAEDTTDFDNWEDVSESGIYKLEVMVELDNDDFLDNNIRILWIGVDAEPPETTHTIDPAEPNGENNWYISFVTITLNATDNWTGVAETVYRINGGSWKTYTAPVEIYDDFEHTFEYYSVDNVGNEEDINEPVSFKIDQTPPTINLIKEKLGGIIFKKFLFTAEVEDETSGVDKVEFYLDGELQQTNDTEPYEWEWTGSGNHTVYAIVYDLAGNKATSNEQYTPYSQNVVQDKKSVNSVLKTINVKNNIKENTAETTTTQATNTQNTQTTNNPENSQTQPLPKIQTI